MHHHHPDRLFLQRRYQLQRVEGLLPEWYESLLSNRLIMNSVYTTLLVSLLSTIVASIAGTFAAIGLYA